MNLELLLANHPIDCLTCEQNGNCTLQDLAYERRRSGEKSEPPAGETERLRERTHGDDPVSSSGDRGRTHRPRGPEAQVMVRLIGQQPEVVLDGERRQTADV